MKTIIAILALSLAVSACSSTGSRGLTVYYQDETDGKVKSYQLAPAAPPTSTDSLCDLCNPFIR